jgi:hypothetical protein
MRLRIIGADGTRLDRIVTAPVARLGRNTDCELSFDPVLYPKVSGEHARIEHTPTGVVLTHLKPEADAISDLYRHGTLNRLVIEQCRIGATQGRDDTGEYNLRSGEYSGQGTNHGPLGRTGT